MDQNKSLKIASVVFGIIAFVHFLRSIFGWPASIGTFSVPVYFSYIAVIVAGYLSWLMYNAGRK